MHLKFKWLCSFTMLLLCLCLLFPVTAQATSYDCNAGIHDFDTVIIDATETNDGSITYTCKLCGYSYSDRISATGHAWGSWIVNQQPTCVSGGHEYRLCQYNDGHIQEQTIPATGVHDYLMLDTEPTCSEVGTKNYTCRYCGDSYSEVYGEALGHDYHSVITEEASCEHDGHMNYTCSRCGDSYTDTISALGHVYGSWITDKEPTQKEDGHRYQVCARDENHIIEETIPMLVADPVMPTEEIQKTEETQPVKQTAVISRWLDYMLCISEAVLVSLFSVALISQYKIIKWDKELEKKYRRGKGGLS